MPEPKLNRMPPLPPIPTPQQLLGDPTISTWLKDSLAAALTRDPVDALRDAELLALVLTDRAVRVAHEASR